MKYKAKKYNIGEVAKYYGMTVDALRLYDKKGILSPYKDDDTNYRIYDRGDFVTMDYVMRMRQLDLSLDNIKTMLNDQTLKEMSTVVSDQKKHMEEQIASLQDKLVLINDYESLLKDSMENLEKPRIRTAPFFISQSIKTTMAETMKDFDSIKKESIPPIHIKIESYLKDGRDVGRLHKSAGMIYPPGSPASGFYKGTKPQENEIVLNKTCSGIHVGTHIDRILRNMDIKKVIVVGFYTDQCVSTSVRDLSDLGYEVDLIEDAVNAMSEERHINAMQSIRKLYANSETTESLLGRL